MNANEHIAQYALEDGPHASLKQRAGQLCMFVGYLDGMQDRCAAWLPRTSYLPSKEAMRAWVI